MERACPRSSPFASSGSATGRTATGTARATGTAAARCVATRWPPAPLGALATFRSFVHARDHAPPANANAGHLAHERVGDRRRDFHRGVPLANIHAAELRARDARFIGDRADEVARPDVVGRA